MFNTASSPAMEIARPAPGQAPEAVQLLPPGPDIVGRDGRRWTLPDPAALIAAFATEGRDLPIDWEHATEIRGAEGKRAPAAGWITALEVREGAIWGRVEWTDEGARSVAAREYRYISPVFVFDQGLTIRALRNAGLTNSPNLRLAALNRTDTAMDLTPVTAALGIAPTATVEEMTTACNRLRSSAATPDPAKFAPRAELTTALNRAATAETELAAIKAATAEAEVTAAVDAAVLAGRIAPASRDFYTAACRAQGVAAFTAFAATLPEIAAPRTPKADPAAHAAPAAALSDDELAMCRATGRSAVEFATFKAADAATV